nr:DUF2345 domain-containing protein [uncultured Caldimonas sp.]
MTTSNTGTYSSTGGGWGRVPAWSRPNIVVSAPGGIALLSPASQVWYSGGTASFVSNDISFTAQRNRAMAVAGGISWFTYGKASNPGKPNQETGIKLHAATGNVAVQAQSAAVKLTADKSVVVSSTHGSIEMGAPKRVRLMAGGSALLLEGSDITLVTPGVARFKASMKELTGPSSAHSSVELPQVAPLKGCSQKLLQAATTGGQLV